MSEKVKWEIEARLRKTGAKLADMVCYSAAIMRDDAVEEQWTMMLNMALSTANQLVDDMMSASGDQEATLVSSFVKSRVVDGFFGRLAEVGLAGTEPEGNA